MTDVLLIGFTAEAVDLTGRPYDVDQLRTAIADGDEAVADAGFSTRRAWIDTDHDAGVDGVAATLREHRFDIVLIGDGIRGNASQTELFERLVNVVHRLAPESRFAFNADPASTVEALNRVS